MFPMKIDYVIKLKFTIPSNQRMKIGGRPRISKILPDSSIVSYHFITIHMRDETHAIGSIGKRPRISNNFRLLDSNNT